MKTEATYANFLSWVTMRSNFKYQYAVPEPMPKIKTKFLKWYEDNKMNIDVSQIKIEKPIFIISLPRTGSSMLQNILCTHPDLAYITYLIYHYYPNFCAAEHFRKKLNLNLRGERYLNDSVMIEATSAADPISIWSQWMRSDPFSSKYITLKKDQLTGEELNTIYTTFKKVIWCFDGKASRLTFKMPGMLANLPIVNELFPDAKIIYLVRHPRQCVNSMVKLHQKSSEQLQFIRSKKKTFHNGKSLVPYPHLPKLTEYIDKYGVGDIRTAAHVWVDGMRFVEEMRSKIKNIYNVRYEDILANPKEEISKILEFCELPEFKQDNSRFWYLLNSIGKIHHKNNYDRYDVIEEICQDAMGQYGYH